MGMAAVVAASVATGALNEEVAGLGAGCRVRRVHPPNPAATHVPITANQEANVV